jgi:hypothetical protein
MTGATMIADVEPVQVEVRADHDTGGVSLEIADRTGSGFRTIFDQAQALDVNRLLRALIALRNGGKP